MTKITLATRNIHKVQEIQSYCMHRGIEIVAVPSGIDLEIEEDGHTFLDNAIKKAMHVWQKINGMVVADDSGLVIPALNGAPGVRSRRFAEELGGYSATFAFLERELAHDQRAAKMVCALALIKQNGECLTAEGSCPGTLSFPPCGGNTFGYDPIFQPQGSECTFAQMSIKEKSMLSHRRIAMDMMFAKL